MPNYVANKQYFLDLMASKQGGRMGLKTSGFGQSASQACRFV